MQSPPTTDSKGTVFQRLIAYQRDFDTNHAFPGDVTGREAFFNRYIRAGIRSGFELFAQEIALGVFDASNRLLLIMRHNVWSLPTVAVIEQSQSLHPEVLRYVLRMMLPHVALTQSIRFWEPFTVTTTEGVLRDVAVYITRSNTDLWLKPGGGVAAARFVTASEAQQLACSDITQHVIERLTRRSTI